MTYRKLIGALVLGAAAATGIQGCATATSPAEPRGPVQTVTDASITARVKTLLAADELVKARNINVDTHRGVVTLHGSVRSRGEADRAVALARTVGGVIDVKSNLTVI